MGHRPILLDHVRFILLQCLRVLLHQFWSSVLFGEKADEGNSELLGVFFRQTPAVRGQT